MTPYQRKRIDAVYGLLDPAMEPPFDRMLLAERIVARLDRLAHEDVDERLRDAFQLAAVQEN